MWLQSQGSQSPFQDNQGQSLVNVSSSWDDTTTLARAAMSRIVAATLERQWEESLERERAIKEKYDRYCGSALPQLNADEEARIIAPASDIPALAFCDDDERGSEGDCALPRRARARHCRSAQ